MPFPVCQQPSSIRQMSSSLRWFIFLIGLLETGLWAGTIFGWPSIVHLLKKRGVYSSLCPNSLHQNTTDNAMLMTLISSSTTEFHPYSLDYDHHQDMNRCEEQDEQFVLVGTVTIVVYALPGVLIGYSLHHLGLSFTRVVACLMVSIGFLFFSITTKENPDYIWGGTILLAIGGNMVRMSCLQFGNLFPNRRNTFMAILSGFYTVSAALFMVVQVLTEAGYKWENLCQSLAVASLMMIVVTPFMPLYHVPYVDRDEETTPLLSENRKVGESEEDLNQPLSKSFFSWSWLLHTYWLFSVLFATNVFNTYFNAWITVFSHNTDEVAYYSRSYGYANLLCGFVAPVPGLLADVITKNLREGTRGINSKIAGVQAMIAPLVMVTFNMITQLSCFFFFSPYAVFVALFYHAINRPSCLGVGLPLLRARFPVNHFNRLIGIQGTILCLLTSLQYPYFAWTVKQYFVAHGALLGFILIGLLCPLHLTNRSYLHRVLSHSQSQPN